MSVIGLSYSSISTTTLPNCLYNLVIIFANISPAFFSEGKSKSFKNRNLSRFFIIELFKLSLSLYFEKGLISSLITGLGFLAFSFTQSSAYNPLNNSTLPLNIASSVEIVKDLPKRRGRERK